MRIIAGEYRRRKLRGPGEKDPARPIPDLVKEATFNLLRGHTEGQAVLDVFAGTGSIGLEAVSRGAKRCVFVDRDRGMLRLLEENIETLGAGDACRVVKGDALGVAALNACPDPVHLIFMDPPYPLVLTHDGWTRVTRQISRLARKLDDDGYLVVRTPWPFMHQEQADGVPDEREPRDTTRQRGRHFTDDDGDQMVEVEMDDLQPDADAGPAQTKKPKPKLIEPSMSIEGMIGPETHDYGTTAIHLYMREPRE